MKVYLGLCGAEWNWDAKAWIELGLNMRSVEESGMGAYEHST